MNNEAVLQEFLSELRAMRQALNDHIMEENVFLQTARDLIAAHGTNELLAARISFVNIMMEREADRRALRKAIIEKTTIGALWALLIFIAVSVQHELVSYFRK